MISDHIPKEKGREKGKRVFWQPSLQPKTSPITLVELRTRRKRGGGGGGRDQSPIFSWHQTSDLLLFLETVLRAKRGRGGEREGKKKKKRKPFDTLKKTKERVE